MPLDPETSPKKAGEINPLCKIKNTKIGKPPLQLSIHLEDWETFREILQTLYDIVTSPEFAVILEIIKKIIEAIIGSGSLIGLMGYEGFQPDIVNKYVNFCSFLVTLTKNDMGLFNDKLHAVILFLNVLSNKDLLAFAIDWKTIILQIIIWIIEKILGNGASSEKAAETNSYIFNFIRYVSLVICLHNIQLMLVGV